ncbi:hypothetical protein BDP27DRAFT_1370171 [Rhodocollybia butyracea]|uniref:Uncharacterized protein n=1 Tax=Rhodocollybia butyracea TaxID=206335 RepID=A0A9P5PCB4_9AGAR|nr:hypothetical protein BDP27DRAFT_1370171 [Rhodocollybia butyracea]
MYILYYKYQLLETGGKKEQDTAIIYTDGECSFKTSSSGLLQDVLPCGNTLGNSSVHISDNESTTICVSDHSGTVVHPIDSPCTSLLRKSGSLPSATCALTVAKLNDAPQDESSGKMELKIMLVEMVLFAPTDQHTLQNSIFLPRSLLNRGESPISVTSDRAFPGIPTFCAMNSTNTSDFGDIDSSSPLLFAF